MCGRSQAIAIKPRDLASGDLRGTLLSRDEMLAAAAALRPVSDAEWNVGVG